MNILFSIIIPVFNTKKEFLIESINSALSVNYDNYEILIVDDGSNKETKDLLSTFNNSKIKIINHETNKGLPSSRKTGLNNAKGDYIFFLDSDDLIDNNALNVFNDIVLKTNSDVIMYSLPRFSGSINNIVVEKDNFFKEGIVEKNNVLSELLKLHINSICCKCAKRDLLYGMLNNSNTSIVMGEDLQQSTNLVLSANSFYYTDKDIYFYRINEENRSYYDITNLNDMNFLVPTYKMVFQDDSNSELLSTFKNSAINSVIYRIFKLCEKPNYKELLDKLNDTEIVSILSNIKQKCSIASELIFSLLIKRQYSILKTLSFIFNKLHKDY